MSPAEIILLKNLVSSSPDMDSSAWDRVRAGIKDRAFFSSRVESVRFLDVCCSKIADLLGNVRNSDGALTSRAEVVSSIMRAAREAGISSGSASISDPGSEARANVIIDTNAGLAAGYARLEMDSTLGARIAFPCYELVRIEERNVPRDWRSKWIAKGGRLYQGRMVALKDDPIWTAISRFGCPYPPFDYNSGMGLDDVSHDEAVSLGVIKDDYEPPEKSPLESFNANLEADLNMDRTSASFSSLKDDFGDQIIERDGKAMWRSQFVRDTIEESYGENGRIIKLGKVSDAALSKVPDELKSILEGSKGERMGLTLTKELATHLKDHKHYKVDPRKTNIPIQPHDLDLVPTLWRDPDRVVQDEDHKDGLVFEMKTGDGGLLRLPIIRIGNSIRTGTLYKKRQTRGRAGVDNDGRTTS